MGELSPVTLTDLKDVLNNFCLREPLDVILPVLAQEISHPLVTVMMSKVKMMLVNEKALMILVSRDLCIHNNNYYIVSY